MYDFHLDRYACDTHPFQSVSDSHQCETTEDHYMWRQHRLQYALHTKHTVFKYKTNDVTEKENARNKHTNILRINYAKLLSKKIESNCRWRTTHTQKINICSSITHL